MRTRHLLPAILLAANLAAADSQSGEVGLPFVTWISPQEYAGSVQVFSLAQDDRGLLYAGLNTGLREYDGTSWRFIATPHGAVIRSLALGPGGRIFIGEVGDFGYLEPDDSGARRYRSLLEFVPKEDREFQDIRKVLPTPEGIYFQSFERLFLLTPDGDGWRTKVWKPQTTFRNAFYLSGNLYVCVAGVGLARMNGGQLESLPAPGLETSIETSLSLMLPYSTDGKQILLASRDGLLFLLDDRGLHPFPVDAAAILKSQRISTGVQLQDGSYAIGTRNGGLVLLEKSGKTRRYLDRSSNVLADGVLALFVDHNGTLWAGLQNGISKIEVSSALTEFGATSGMSASVNDLLRFRGKLYVGTMNGLKLLDSASGQFRTVPIGKANSAFSLLAHKDKLLIAAARDGLFEFDGTTARRILADTNAISYFIVVLSRHNPDRVWIGSDKGLASLRVDPSGRWIDEGLVAKTPAVRSIVETDPGSLWLGTESRGVYRVKLDNKDSAGPPHAASVEAFGKTDGLATEGGVDVLSVLGRVAFVSPQGVREFDPASRRFVESTFFKAIPTGGESGGSNQATDANGNVWINFGLRPVLALRQPDGSYQFDANRVRRIGDGLVTGMFGDSDGVVWFGGPDRIFRYDPSKASAGRQPSPVLLRRVTTGDRDKRVLYAGGGGDAASRRPEIPFKNNELRFEYTVASFEDPSKNQFQTRLEGFDQDWSAWTSETRRDYTNLPPGNYRFLIRGRNVFAQESPEAEYRLLILPPWYRTWWAYLAYALLLAAAVYTADRILRRRVIARERAASQAKALQAEIEQKRNIELLSEIGKQLTSSLEIDTIFGKLYDNVNQLMDATIFGVGIYHPEEHTIEYRLAFDSGKRYEPYRRDTHDKNQFPVWCIDNGKPVFINDVSAEYARYISKYQEPGNKLEDGSVSAYPQSLIYLPLIAKERVLGIITVQSRRKHAYTGYHLNLLENLAAYTSIALDNADAYQHLKSAQEQLVTQEKLASLGALTAGIAHEIKNPLNFVNNFADLSVELMQELHEELGKHKDSLPAEDYENIESLLGDLSGNAKKINEHGRRADGIVRSMLLHSRGQAGERQPTDVNAMLDEYVNLSYHGMRAQDSSFNITIERHFAPDVGKIDAIPQDLSRVFLNLLNNACYAANDKAKRTPSGYVPTLLVRTLNLGESVEVRVRDNGMGIPPDVRDKIFHPFFTTKPTGQGTGLGLSISHDIVVQEHGGQLDVETEPGEFTEFVVRLPRRWRKAA